ncbi:MAG: hypothetical protein EON85_09450 [Brevundimonas sp.]|nr:MAG: hypothetical protein EON85_09450 [Brevundimonas sp.]
MIRAVIAAALCAPLLSGCVIYANEGGEEDVVVRWSHDRVVPPLEAVRSARIADGRLTVRVDSNGCTDSTRFAVDVTPVEDGATNIALRRNAEDLCKALVPDGVEVSWSLDELGVEPGTPTRLLNPTKL